MALHLCKSLYRLSSPALASYSGNKLLHPAFSLRRNSSLDNVEKKVINEEKREKRGKTSDNPILVGSHSDKIIVGCNCSSTDPTLRWFFLEDGPAQVCDCGFYFKLDQVKTDQWIPDYAQIMQIDKTLEDPREGNKGFPFVRPKATASTGSSK